MYNNGFPGRDLAPKTIEEFFSYFSPKKLFAAGNDITCLKRQQVKLHKKKTGKNQCHMLLLFSIFKEFLKSNKHKMSIIKFYCLYNNIMQL